MSNSSPKPKKISTHAFNMQKMWCQFDPVAMSTFPKLGQREFQIRTNISELGTPPPLSGSGSV
jgi:hypothetical protein